MPQRSVHTVASGAGTNLKVGGLVRRDIGGGGAPLRHETPEKKLLVLPLHFFGSKYN